MYFTEYGICAKGISDFVASVGVPFFSFDACHAKHLYYRGVYDNAVALIDTEAESLTNYEIALTTDPESKQEGLYASLFKVMGSDENESELINRMKEKSSVVISDDCPAFRSVAKAALGNDRRFASCAWHVMSNAKKKRSGWDEKELFWPYQQARTLQNRDMKWTAMMNKVPREAAAWLREQKTKEERENANTWTALKHIEAGMCMFNRCGANNTVEQSNARQVKERGGNSVAFLRHWCQGITKLEGKLIEAAEKLEKNSDIPTPWAMKRLEDSMNQVFRVRLDE